MATRPGTGGWPITITGMLESAPAPVATPLAAASANDTEAFLSMFVEGAVVDD
jgi:hypothetical protein